MLTVGKEQNNDAATAKNTLSFTPLEIRYLKHSWEKANSMADIGCELVAGLLNDNRTRFRALIESHSNDWLGSATFTADDVKKYERAHSVANGVVLFFNQVISELDELDASELIALQSQRLGASHFRMKVWFQAENWLCVKNCLLETIMKALVTKNKTFPVCGKTVALSEKKSREVWYKVIQFVIQNMKKGFLAEALSSDNTSGSSHGSI